MECPIVMFFHCRKCLETKPANKSPKEWARLNAGFTADHAIQIWCVRHEMPVATFKADGTVEKC